MKNEYAHRCNYIPRLHVCLQGQADTEWKFARSKLYMEYIKDESTLPIPFNIIPSPKTVFYILKTVFGCFCCCTGDEGQQTIAHPGRVVDLEMFPPSTVGGQVVILLFGFFLYSLRSSACSSYRIIMCIDINVLHRIN
jgi:hypothetical protein